MEFISIRMITEDVPGLVAFYERATGMAATWRAPRFAEIRTGRTALAIGGTETAPFPAGSVIVEFLVDDVDQLRHRVDQVVQEPATMPWGNRSMLFHDPDGHPVNFFKPVNIRE